jgi:dipeptidyl aminopeptidase/acylaminoacyl peptidase
LKRRREAVKLQLLVRQVAQVSDQKRYSGLSRVRRASRLPRNRISQFLSGALLVLCAVNADAADTRATHEFLAVRISPDGRYVASVEGDASPAGGAPTVRELVIRSSDGRTSTSVALPCGRVRECWPSSPAWTPDSRKLSFALRLPGTHKRSLYQVGADGSGLSELLAFDGTLTALHYGPAGQLAVLAIEGATKELGAVEAGAPVTGDLQETPPEQRIAVLDGGRLRWASPPELFVYEYDWLPDGRGFVGTAAPGDGDNNWWVAKLYAFDAESAGARVLYTPASAQQQLAEPRVSRDGRHVALIIGLMSDFGATGGDVYLVPIAGGTATPVTGDWRASAKALYWTCTGALNAVALARDKTQVIDLGHPPGVSAARVLWEGQETLDEDAADLPGACPSGVGALTRETFTRAAEIQVGTVGKWRNLTHSNDGLSAPFTAQSLTWTSDAYSVQGWLLRPQSAPSAARLPVITIVHGGPASAVQPHYVGADLRRLLLEHGYALFLPNPRGSYGQGEAFTRANVRDFGYGDLHDILRGLDELERRGLADPQRLGLMGHSYGGFMTMWAVTQTNRFKAAVAGAGVSNWQSYYGENGIDEWMIPYFGGSVYQDPAVYAKSSAINYIRQVRTPTLSYVGAADIECPAPQTQEFGHALRVLDVPSQTLIYPDEGHSLHDPAHLADLHERILKWFDRYLRQP